MTKKIVLNLHNTVGDDFLEKNVFLPESNELTPISFIDDLTPIGSDPLSSDQAKINECISAINSIKDALVSFGLMSEDV